MGFSQTTWAVWFAANWRNCCWPVIATLSLAILAGCGGSSPPNTQASVDPVPSTLLVSGDTAGWIAPCGCVSSQSGGLLRRHSMFEAIGKDQQTIAVDVGGAAQGTSAYDRMKFEAILRGELAMELSAHNLGASEIRLGTDYLKSLPSELRAVFVSANTRDSRQQPLAPAVRVVPAGSQRLAIVGVVGEEFATAAVEVLPPKQAVLGALKSVAGKFDRAVVLAYVNEESLHELAAALPEVDLVVGGPTGQSIVPKLEGRVTTAAVTNKGKFIGVFAIPPAGSSAPWQGRIVEMTDEWSDHSRQQENLKQFYAALKDRQLQPQETSFAPTLPVNTPADFRVAGSAVCITCHQSDCRDSSHAISSAQDWGRSKHNHAWDSLQKNDAYVDAYCQQCHSTGYGLPGGFATLASSPKLSGVGCESCHGPSLAHAQTPQQYRTAYSKSARDKCAQCHDRENSPHFVYDRYWAALVTGEPPNAVDPPLSSK